MGTQIHITPKSGLTVGATAVTSGTDTGVFFQQGGVLQQDSNFTYDSTLKRLQLKATTGNGINDIPFLIRNSADNLDIVRITANGNHVLGSDGGTTLTLSAKSGFSFTTLNLNGQGNTERVALRQTLNRLTFTHTNSNTVSSTLTTTGLAIGFGDIAATAKLDIKAQGALSTDIALRVRNSVDTANIFEVRGDGHSVFSAGNPVFIGFGAGSTSQGHLLNMRFGLSTSTPFAYFDNASFNLDVDRFCNVKLGFGLINANSQHSIALGLGTIPTSRNYQQTVAFWTAISQGTNDSGFAQSGADTIGNSAVYTNYYGRNIVLGGTTQGNGKNVFVMLNGTVPSSNITNGGQLYVEGGALKFRGSSGTITTVAPA